VSRYRSLFFDGPSWVRTSLAAAICVTLGIALPVSHITVVPAHAACLPTASNNVSAVCTGDTINAAISAFPVGPPTGYGSGGEDDVTVTVQPGALVQGDFIGIYLGERASLFNSGTVLGQPGGGGAGFAGFSINSVVNTGSIQGDIDGIGSDNSIRSIINSGIIRGLTADGVFADTTLNSLFNSGTIIGGVDGVYAVDIASLVNTGLLQGARDEGVYAFDTIGSLTNFGTIRGGDDGVQAEALASLVNHGVIEGVDDGVDVSEGPIDSLINYGVIAGGDSAPGSKSGVVGAVIRNLVNSGTISSLGFAIEERGPGGDTNLTLNAGSILIGLIDLGGGTNILNIGAGRSLNSRFDTDDGIATLPVLGLLAGHLVAFDGTATQRQVVAVDQSAFLSFDDALHALVLGIGQTVQGRQAALRSDPALGFASRFAAAEETSLAAFSDLNLEDTPHLNPNRFWIEGFGAYRQDDGDRVGSDFDHLSGGLVAGFDVPVDTLTSVGVMAGFAASTSENEINTQQTDTTSFYAGVYASTPAMGLAWDASLTLGYTDYDQERITANNLVAGGLETARANFGGWFINPQFTMTREAGNPLAGAGFGSLVAAQTLEQSLTLSYAGLFLDGYTETGTTNPLTLNGRDVHVASARAALTLPFEAAHADGALTTLRLIGGLEARTQFGDDSVSGSLLGQAVSTTLGGDDESLGGFLGLSGEYQTASGLTAYANTEAMLETNSAWQASATAGLRIAF
jgi:hypothetical protein